MLLLFFWFPHIPAKRDLRLSIICREKDHFLLSLEKVFTLDSNPLEVPDTIYPISYQEETPAFCVLSL